MVFYRAKLSRLPFCKKHIMKPSPPSIHFSNGSSKHPAIGPEGYIIDDYDTVFCEFFCLAAASLANKMDEDLVDAGILWYEILMTGGRGTTDSIGEGPANPYRGDSVAILKRDVDDLVEKGMMSGRWRGCGYLMFLVRRADSDYVVDHLAASGYRFAEPHQVSHIIGSKMQSEPRNSSKSYRTWNVEVKKEGDAVTTFVDDLFSSCIDTPGRM
ncbi:hypothetical protein MFIFM68171_07038 [Madurella fahalii]|uniref:Uncharacterized protein n=1 Tax=Madurella fahalii TaxID=1157608 RepID=A0ABQ0GGE8_9PEZI